MTRNIYYLFLYYTMNIFFLIILSMFSFVHAHQDRHHPKQSVSIETTGGLIKFEYNIQSVPKYPKLKSVEVTKNVLQKITVTRAGQVFEIPKSELSGIDKINFDSTIISSGEYNGVNYFYINTLFGERDESAKEKYKRVWFLFEDKYKVRKVFKTVKTDQGHYSFKQLTEKFAGQEVRDCTLEK